MQLACVLDVLNNQTIFRNRRFNGLCIERIRLNPLQVENRVGRKSGQEQEAETHG